EALWRAARARVMVGMSEKEIVDQNSWYDEAIRLGDRAVALRPDGVEGLHWRGAALGRRALNASAGYAAELAQRVFEDANAILALDPDHAGAHNLLGQLFVEVMSLSRIERFIGRMRYDNDALRESSWEAAEHHLQAAVDLAPNTVQFQLDLAKLYERRGREEEARQALEQVLELAPVHPPDASLQRDAERLLEELGS
ncbi:MAG TPA: tetratricopeptide repeat protein, partial [Longimicrobiales bacterium]|nr:tetratricopeptide repeat protein [Longimicrobiales bacterium]